MQARAGQVKGNEKRPGRLAAKTQPKPMASALSLMQSLPPEACACDGGCPRCLGTQMKSMISRPQDRSELEADQVAEKIVALDRLPKTTVAVKPIETSAKPQPQPTPKPKAKPALPMDALPEGEELEEELPEQGMGLSFELRSFFENRLSHHFSRVRLHTDAKAQRLARRYGAKAFTHGHHIVFGSGAYAPRQEEGLKLLAHEMVHVVQQHGGSRETALPPAGQTAPVSSTPVHIARTPDLDDDIERIDSLLSYGLFDWVITDDDARQAMAILRRMSNEDRIIALQRINVGRLRSNIPDELRLELAVMLVAGESTQTLRDQIRELLSYGVFDWAITDAEATHVFNLLAALANTRRDQMLGTMGRFYRRRLYENLPSESMRTQFMQWWDERTEREIAEQEARLHPAPPSAPAESPVERKHREFMEFITIISHRPEAEREEQTRREAAQPVDERHPLPSSQVLEQETRFRYDQWIERHQDDPEYLTISPADLWGRLYGDLLHELISHYHAQQEARTRIERQGRRSLEQWQRFQDFIHNRLEFIQQANPTEAHVQEQILRAFIHWTAEHQDQPGFLRARPLDIYERLGHQIITPEIDRERMRAESTPQSDEARQQKLDDFLTLANRLRSFRDQFPRLVPVPSQGRDILIHGSPAIQYVLDAMAAELGDYALNHYYDGDFTAQSPTSVLLTIVRANEDVYHAAQLLPWLHESIIRTDLDPNILARSFATSLGQVLLVSALIGIVVGAEVLTLGQVTWIMLAFAGYFGVNSFLERREEIEQTNIDVPVAETVLHSAGDVIGLSQVIEGATGVRLGTEQRLNSVQRSEELGGGAGQLVGIFLASRAFRAGRGAGASWRARIMGTGTAGPPPVASLLPGPAEQFPFSGRGEPLPVPERPNTVYRIMNLSEAAEALRTNSLPESVRGTSGQKYFTLDSRYAMLFRERALAEAGELGSGIEAMEGNLAQLEARIEQIRAGHGDASRLPQMEANRTRLQERITQETARVRGQAQGLINDWFYNPDQSVVVEIELQEGALDHMLRHAVDQRYINQYQGQNVYIYLVERGYGRNIAVPSWLMESFNRNFVKSIRLHSTRAPFGESGLSTTPGHTVMPGGGN